MNARKSTKWSLLVLFFCPLFSFAQIHFTDVTRNLGVQGYDWFGAHGVTWVDVNGDGRLDIYVKNVAGKIYDVPNNLFINNGTQFLEEALDRGVADAYGLGTHGAVFADFDQDGDFDLFSTTTFDHTTAHNHLYLNDGSGYFTDVTSMVQPSQDINTSARGVAAADFDQDGDMDFFFSNALANTDPFNPNPFPPKQLRNFCINNGDGTYSLRHRGIYWTGFVQGVTAIDVDGDGDIDIAEGKWTMPSTIYLNDGNGRFTDSGADMGLPQTLRVRNNGLTFGDVDNDGDLDLVVIGNPGVDLYRNISNNFIFYQNIEILGNGSAHVSLGDFDHDGDLDLYVSGGNVYENDGMGNYFLIPTASSGLDSSLGVVDPRGSGLGDFDNDGDLDIFVSDKKYFNVLMQNDQNDSHWIQVDIIDQLGAAGGIGTKLDLYVSGQIGDPQYLRGHREVHGEYGYLGQDMPTLHFGAPGNQIYDLKVTFTDGTVKEVIGIYPGQKILIDPSVYVYAPLNFTGTRKQNDALFYREDVIDLDWNPNPENENIQKYRIYRIEGGALFLLTEVSHGTFEYRIRHAEKNTALQYGLTAVDTDGREGDAAYVTVN